MISSFPSLYWFSWFVLFNLKQAVAVKKLDQTGLQGEKEFLVEVLMLSLLRHSNLVSLIGYCAEGEQRLLVYEYMPLGSLADHLHGTCFDAIHFSLYNTYAVPPMPSSHCLIYSIIHLVKIQRTFLNFTKSTKKRVNRNNERPKPELQQCNSWTPSFYQKWIVRVYAQIFQRVTFLITLASQIN